ncbi:MAG: hypothetical protein EA390_01865 [Balneolaceae bacterium]|nr:MAG: hypothetical protein EA390_01865 [Balneolaceae bacterium]
MWGYDVGRAYRHYVSFSTERMMYRLRPGLTLGAAVSRCCPLQCVRGMKQIITWILHLRNGDISLQLTESARGTEHIVTTGSQPGESVDGSPLHCASAFRHDTGPGSSRHIPTFYGSDMCAVPTALSPGFGHVPESPH